MELLSLVLVLADVACTFVFGYASYHLFRFVFSRYSDWREECGLRPWSIRRCVALAFLSAASLVL